MKIHFLISGFYLLFSLTMIAQTEKQKTALLIGVGDYAEGTNWQDLQSANDVELLKGTLIKKGFSEQNIFTLTNSEATYSGIKKALSDFEKRVKKGGVAFFHFSGHGQQIWDDNNDEIDGLDEALVPHNSIEYYIEDQYIGDSLVRDDLLEKSFLSIRKRLGEEGHLLVTIDACHSGTGIRGFAKARGTNRIMASEDYLKKNGMKKKDKTTLSLKSSSSDGVVKIAPVVALFSSGANQLSYEGRSNEGVDYGIFTHAFCEQVLNSKPNETYQSVFSKIKRSIAKKTGKQTPQIEGDSYSILFDGTLRKELSYFSVRKVIMEDLVVLDAGSLSGFYCRTLLN